MLWRACLRRCRWARSIPSLNCDQPAYMLFSSVDSSPTQRNISQRIYKHTLLLFTTSLNVAIYVLPHSVVLHFAFQLLGYPISLVVCVKNHFSKKRHRSSKDFIILTHAVEGSKQNKMKNQNVVASHLSKCDGAERRWCERVVMEKEKRQPQKSTKMQPCLGTHRPLKGKISAYVVQYHVCRSFEKITRAYNYYFQKELEKNSKTPNLHP